MVAFGRDASSGVDLLGVTDDEAPPPGSPLRPEAVAARFLAYPDHFVNASVGDGTFEPERAGARGFRTDILGSRA
jgi:hypothetical protein